jgi:hypothetical protein
MKIPKKLKIGGHVFKIEQKNLKGICGETDFVTSTISLRKDMVKSMKESTLIHEIICHAINSTFTGESHLAHAYMDSVAEQLYQVLKENNLLK